MKDAGTSGSRMECGPREVPQVAVVVLCKRKGYGIGMFILLWRSLSIMASRHVLGGTEKGTAPCAPSLFLSQI